MVILVIIFVLNKTKQKGKLFDDLVFFFPTEIITYGEKPFLTEKGPYVYSERRHKKDIVFAQNGTIVSFR